MGDGREPPRLSSGGGAPLSPQTGERRPGPRPWPPEEQPPGDELHFYLEVLRRQWRLVAGVVLVLVLGTAAGTLLSPSTYRASGLLEIRRGDAEMQGRESLLPRGNVTDEYLQTQYGILESKAVAREVVETLRLDTVRSTETGRSGAGEARPLQPLVEKIQSGLEVDPREGSRLVRVSYEAGDPQFAADVVNAALNGYVDVRVRAGQDVVSWLSRQVDSAKAELQRSERELRAYAMEHDLPVLETADGAAESVVDQRLRRLEEEITAVQADRIGAESRYRQVAEGSTSGAVDNRVIEELLIDLAALRKEYARLTTLFQESYPKARQVERQIEELEEELKQEKARVTDRLESEYRTARRQEELLQEAADEQRELGRRMADESGQYHLLRREVETNRKLVAAFQQTRKEAEVSAALREARFGIVDLAVPPRSPVGPGLKQNLALALIAGIVLGVGGAFVRERFHGVVGAGRDGREGGRLAPPLRELITRDDGKGEASYLGSSESPAALEPPQPRELPAGRGDPPSDDRGPGSWNAGTKGRHAVDRRTGPTMRTLRAAIFTNGDGTPPSSVLVTSCQPEEGASRVAADLARSLASAGQRTLLVDADLRRPSLPWSVVGGTPGLWEHLTEERSWGSLVLEGNGNGSLDVLPAGCTDGDPGPALSSSRMQAFLAEARERYDRVIVNSAALLADAADARVLFGLVDGVLVVAREDVTPRGLVHRVMEKAPRAWGVVVGSAAVGPESGGGPDR